jgi:type I restriction enzyme S subunit
MSKASPINKFTSKVGSGATPRGGKEAYLGGDYALIRSQNVHDFIFSNDGLAYIDDAQAKKLDNVEVKKGDVLLNITGDSIARCCSVPNDILPARVNQHVSIIRCKNIEDSEYLKYYLINLKSYLMQICGVGGTRNALTKEAVEKLIVKFQDNHLTLAKVLSSLDSKIELNNKINKELEAMAKTLYDYWFVQFDFPDENGKPYKSSGGKMVYNQELKREIPEGWEVDELKNLISIERGISYKSSDITDMGIPMVNLNSFYLDGTYKPEGIKYFNSAYNNNKIVKAGDLIIATTDVTRNADIIGKATLIPDIYNSDIILSCDIAKINCKDSLNKYFLEKLFNSDFYHNYIKGFASGTLVLHLNTNGIDWYKTFIPPNNLLNKFSNILAPIQRKKELITLENQELAKLRDWLLPMLMNGQVSVK